MHEMLFTSLWIAAKGNDVTYQASRSWRGPLPTRRKQVPLQAPIAHRQLSSCTSMSFNTGLLEITASERLERGLVGHREVRSLSRAPK